MKSESTPGGPMHKMFQKCGLVETIRAQTSTQFKVIYNTPTLWNIEAIRKEFPGLYIKITMEAESPGLPFLVGYEALGPKEQILRFIGKYGNENTKELAGITGQTWTGTEWVKV